MKKLTTAIVLLTSLTAARAEPFSYELPTVCDRTEIILSELANKYKETVVWSGEHATDNSRLALFANSKTGSWTLLKMNREYACILGVGSDSTLVLGPGI